MTVLTPSKLADFPTYRRELILVLKTMKDQPEPFFVTKKHFSFSIEGKEWKGFAVLLGKKKGEKLVRSLKKSGIKFLEGPCRRKDKLLLVEGLGDKALKDANRTFARLKLPVRAYSAREAIELQNRLREIKSRLAPRLRPTIASLPKKRDEILALVREAAGLENQGDLAGAIAAFERLEPLIPTGQSQQPASSAPAAGPLTVATTRPAPAPDGLRVYHGTPTAEGGWRKDAGAGQALRVWSQRLQPKLGEVKDRQLKIDVSSKVLEQTIAAGEQKLRAGMKKDFPGGLQKLNKQTNGRAFALIKSYQGYGDRAQQAEVRYSATKKSVDAAQSMSVAATAAVAKFELSGQKEDLEGQRAALQKRVAERQEVIGFLLESGMTVADSMSGPGGVVKFAVGQLAKIVGSMSSAELGELAVIESRLGALETALKKEEDKAVRAELEAARAELASRLDQLVAAKLEVRAWHKQKVRAIEELAALEQSHGTTTTLRTLAEHHDDVVHQGADLRAETDGYVHQLARGDMGAVDGLRQRVALDVRSARVSGVPNDNEWFGVAKGADRYLETLQAWRDQELTRQRAVRDQLAQNRHMAIIEETMMHADLGLGGTTAHKSR